MCQSGFDNSKMFESLGGLGEGGFKISKNLAHPHFLDARILKHNIYQRSNPDRSMKKLFYFLNEPRRNQ